MLCRYARFGFGAAAAAGWDAWWVGDVVQPRQGEWLERKRCVCGRPKSLWSRSLKPRVLNSSRILMLNERDEKRDDLSNVLSVKTR